MEGRWDEWSHRWNAAYHAWSEPAVYRQAGDKNTVQSSEPTSTLPASAKTSPSSALTESPALFKGVEWDNPPPHSSMGAVATLAAENVRHSYRIPVFRLRPLFVH
jgi:hypothetical protein